VKRRVLHERTSTCGGDGHEHPAVSQAIHEACVPAMAVLQAGLVEVDGRADQFRPTSSPTATHTAAAPAAGQTPCGRR
jgi:hypothetical protein